MNPPKAVRAREFLDYCRHAATEMRKDPRGNDWVILWAAAIGLLRAVNDAICNVDAASSPKFQGAYRLWYGRMGTEKKHPPESLIYWEFIRKDRNTLLHSAQLTVAQSAMVPLPGAEVTTLTGRQTREPRTSPQTPRAQYSYRMKTGAFAGRDTRDVVDEAIAWWERQIEEIEKNAV